MTVESTSGPSPTPAYSEPAAVAAPSSTPSEGNSKIKAFNDDDGPGFSDFLDLINPLQHIPLVNTLYRELTGDKEGAVADVIGGGLWGGPIGLAAASVNLLIEDSTGKTIDGHVMALFTGGGDDKATAIADKGTAPAADQTAQPSAEPIKISSLSATATTPLGQTSTDAAPVTMGDFMVFGGQSAVAGTPAASLQTAQAANGVADAMPAASTAPNRQGDFMVFGQPATVADGASQKRASATTAAVNKPAAAIDASVDGGPSQSGDFLVFGSTAPTKTSDSPAPTAPAGEPAAPTSLTPAADATANAQANQQTAATMAQPSRSFPMPTRRNTATPPQSLPMPTTGPAAVPGNGASRAIKTSNQTDNAWFVGAFNEAMDKYNRAAKLGTLSSGSDKSSDQETADSLMQMN